MDYDWIEPLLVTLITIAVLIIIGIGLYILLAPPLQMHAYIIDTPAQVITG